MKFREKTPIIEAIQFTDSTITKCIEFVGDDCRLIDEGSNPKLWFQTLGGEATVHLEDWIVKVGDGNFRVCPSDGFDATYERVQGEGEVCLDDIPVPRKAKARIVERTDPIGSVSYVIQVRHWLFKWLWVDTDYGYGSYGRMRSYPTLDAANKWLPWYDGTRERNRVILYSPNE